MRRKKKNNEKEEFVKSSAESNLRRVQSKVQMKKWRLSHIFFDNLMEARANTLQIGQLVSVQEFECIKKNFIW